MTWGLILPFLTFHPQNVTLDLSKRSRSGKFRLVTKFKKEKNNKNREAHGSLGAPGTAPLTSPWVLRLLARGPWAVTPVVACAELAICSCRADPRPPALRWLLTVVTPGPELTPHADSG